MANNALIGAVRSEATLESGKFVSGAKKIRQEAKTTETQLKRSFGAMGAAAKGFGGALTAGLSIGLLAGLGKKVLDYAGSIGEVAQQLGVTTKELQTFRFAVQQNGGTVEQADQALGKFAISISKARQGSKQAAEAFAAAGVKLSDLETKSKSQILGIIADQFKRTGGAAANAAAGVAIFGKGFLKIAPTLDQGSTGLNQLSAAAEKLGIVLSDQQIQRADETADKLDAVRTVLAAQIAGVVADNAASIVTLAQSLATLTSAIVNFLGSNPQAALGLLGALAGSRFGVPGAAAGGIGGLFLGSRMAAKSRDASTDIEFRMAEVKKAQAEFHRVSKLYGGQGTNVKQRDTARAEVNRQLALLAKTTAQVEAQAIAARNQPKPAPLPQFLAPGGGRGRKGPRPKDTSKEALRDAFQMDQELRRADLDILRAKKALAHDYVDRTALSIEILNLENQGFEAELAYQVELGKLTKGQEGMTEAQAQALRAKHDQVDALERQAILEDEQVARQRDYERLEAVDFDLKRAELQRERELATTNAERRDVELRILDLAYREERERLQRIIDESQDWAEIEEARRRLLALSQSQSADRQIVMRNTAGPLESFKTEFGDISDELESLKVQGIMGAVDALTALTEGFDNFRDVALNAIKQVIAELIRLQLMKLAANIIGTAAGAPPGAVGGSPFSNPVMGFARGGGFNVRGVQGFDKNMLSLNGLPIANVSYGERVSVSNDNSGTSGAVPIPPFIFNNYAKMSAAEARMTGTQAGAAYRQEIARANQKGF